MNILKAILDFFNKKPAEKAVEKAPGIFPGVILDTRPESEKETDLQFGEIVAKAAVVDWKEKPESTWPVYGSQDQYTQSSCVANAGRKAMRVMMRVSHNLDVDPSSLDIYRRRFNYPEGGMAAYDLWNICGKGVTLNSLVPSDGKRELDANALVVEPWKRQVGDVFKISRGVNITKYTDIDSIASVMQKTNKAVVLFFFFTSEEWSRKVPVIIDRSLRVTDDRALRHAVAAVVYTMQDGKKCLVIDDSAHFGGLDRRVITEEFLRARCFYAGYPMNFVFDPQNEAPTHSFDRDIAFGESSDEVKILQECLQIEQCFPSNVTPTGYYGSLTAESVLKFQKKYAVASPSALDRLAGKNVGPATRDALNKIFA